MSYATLRQAILDRNIVTATYDGYHREVCPHAIGREGDREKLFCYQFAGDTSKGPVRETKRWRCFFIDRMQNVTIRNANGEWYTEDNRSKAQICIMPENIDIEV